MPMSSSCSRTGKSSKSEPMTSCGGGGDATPGCTNSSSAARPRASAPMRGRSDMRVQAAGDGCAGPPTLPEHAPALPGLALLREPTRLLGLVQAAWSERLAPSSLVGVEPVVRRYLPGKRCVAEVVLRVSPPVPAPPRAIAKLGSARWAQRTYANVRELWTHGFSAAPFRVPEPLAYVPEWNLLLLDFTEGDVLRERLLARADDESAEREIALAAQWLARLHRSGATPLRRYTLEDHRRALSAGTKRVAPV